METYSKSKVNIMLAALLVCVFIQGFGSYKFIPMQQDIQTFFGINEGAYGILTSAQNWLLIICSVPFGYLARKVPCKWGFVMGFGAAMLGSIVQVLTTNYALFVIGRTMEGAGLGFLQLSATILMLFLVALTQRGMWCSVYIVTVIITQAIISKTAPVLMAKTGLDFRSVFYLILGMYILAVIIAVLVIPKSLRVNGISDATKPTREQTRRVFKNAANWKISIANIAWNTVSVGFIAYVIRYFVIKGLTMNQATTAYSVMTIIGAVSMLLTGIMADKLGTKRKIVIAGYFIAVIATAMLAFIPANLIYIYVVIYSSIPRSIGPLTNASAADIAELPLDIPIVNSIKQTIVQLGSVINIIIVGYLVQFLGYPATLMIMAGELVVGGILWISAKKIP